jgi:hypothetical protein
MYIYNDIHLIEKSWSGLKWKIIEAKTKEGSGKYSLLLKDNNMPKPYSTIRRLHDVWKIRENVYHILICVSLTDFPEPPSVLASMFYHFAPDSDFVYWVCILNKKS